MTEYRKIMYIENIRNNNPNETSVQSLSACLDNKTADKIRTMEYFFCDNINDKVNRNLIIQKGVKDSVILSLIKQRKISGTVGYLIVEVNKTAERDLDKELRGYGIEKIVLN